MALFSLAGTARGCTDVMDTAGMVGRGVPGVWDMGGYLGGLYRVLPQAIPGPIFNLFLRPGPTYGQMKLILSYL